VCLCSVSSQLRVWQQVTLLDPKRANNLGIILSAVKLPFDAMRRAVLGMDTAALPLDSVNALLKCVPSAEELELVANAGVPTAALGFAERFVAEVGTVPRLQKRLECLAYVQRFEGSLRAAACDVAAVSAACGTLCSSADLRRLLGVTLWLGNALNGNSFRGSAEGFRTDALPRLAELRTNSTPPSSLLAVALQHCAAASEEGWAALERLAQQLGSVKAAARLSMTEVADEAGRFIGSLAAVKDELSFHSRASRSASAAAAADGGADRLVEVLEPFVNSVEPRVEALCDELKAMQAALVATHAFFAEEAKTSMEAFFSRWATFAGQLEAALAHETEGKHLEGSKRARRA